MSLTKAQRKFLKTVKEVRERHRDELKVLEKRRLRLARTCKHPEEACKEYKWEWDSGYGRQKWLIGLQCGICGAKNDFPNISNRWSKEK